MSELQQVKRQSAGSGHALGIQEDTNSAVVRELIAQLNQQEIPVTKQCIFAASGTQRKVLGSWRSDAWIKEIRFMNASAVALVNAATDILLKRCAPNDIDLVAGPATPTTVFAVEGFAAGNFPAKTALWGDEFIAGAGGNCDAVTDKRKGFIIPAGEVLYLEVINTEGVVDVDIEVEVILVNTDRIDLLPDRLQDSVPFRNQRFISKPRGEI